MKIVKRLCTLLLLAALGLSLCACLKQDTEAQLTGVWQVVAQRWCEDGEEDEFEEASGQESISFYSDETLSMTDLHETTRGGYWRLQDNTLEVKFDDYTSYISFTIVRLTESELVLRRDYSSDTFTEAVLSRIH